MKCEKVTSYNPYPKIDEKAVAEAAELINQAKRPFALVGHGVELGGAHNELVEFLERLISRLVVPWNAFCSSSNHPYGYARYAWFLCY